MLILTHNSGFGSIPASGNGLLNNLRGHWALGEASGTRLDSTSNNLDLTDNNTVTQGTGKIGNCGQFTKTNSEYLSRASEANLQTGDIDFTIAGWVNGTTLPATIPSIFTKWVTSGNLREYVLWYTQGSDRFAFLVSNDGAANTQVLANEFGAVSTATWYFVACGHDAIGNVIWVSVNNGTADTAAHTTGVATGTAEFNIGAYNAGQEHWDGLIDEFGLWAEDLRGAKLTALYNGGSGLAYSSFTT